MNSEERLQVVLAALRACGAVRDGENLGETERAVIEALAEPGFEGDEKRCETKVRAGSLCDRAEEERFLSCLRSMWPYVPPEDRTRRVRFYGAELRRRGSMLTDAEVLAYVEHRDQEEGG